MLASKGGYTACSAGADTASAGGAQQHEADAARDRRDAAAPTAQHYGTAFPGAAAPRHEPAAWAAGQGEGQHCRVWPKVARRVHGSSLPFVADSAGIFSYRHIHRKRSVGDSSLRRGRAGSVSNSEPGGHEQDAATAWRRRPHLPGDGAMVGGAGVDGVQRRQCSATNHVPQRAGNGRACTKDARQASRLQALERGLVTRTASGVSQTAIVASSQTTSPATFCNVHPAHHHHHQAGRQAGRQALVVNGRACSKDATQFPLLDLSLNPHQKQMPPHTRARMRTQQPTFFAWACSLLSVSLSLPRPSPREVEEEVRIKVGKWKMFTSFTQAMKCPRVTA